VFVGGQMVVGEYQNRVFSDDERSDHGVPVCYRKPPQPQPQTQMQTLTPQNQQRSGSGGGAAIDLPSTDSISRYLIFYSFLYYFELYLINKSE